MLSEKDKTHTLTFCNSISEIGTAIEYVQNFLNGREAAWCCIPWTESQDGFIGAAVGDKGYGAEDVRRVMQGVVAKRLSHITQTVPKSCLYGEKNE